MRTAFIVITILISSVFPALGATGSSVVGLTLRDAVRTALRQNLTLEEEALLFKIAGADLRKAEGEFDPALNFGLRDSFETTGAATLLEGPETEALAYDIALGGKINSGAGYELKLSSERVKMSETPFLLVNPYYTSRLMLTVSQPLLKGLGRAVQESRIRAASYNVEAARLRAEQRAMEIATRTVRAYWDLYFAKNSLDVAALSLKLAENMLREVKARIDAGELAQVDIYGSEAEVALRMERLLMAEKAIHDAADALRAILNTQDWQDEIIAVDVPGGPSDTQPLEELLRAALENRRELKMAVIELESLKVMSTFYKNQRLPELNIQAGAGLNGLGDNYGDALSEASSGDFYSWQVGLTLNVPLRGRTASGGYLRAKNEEEMAALKIRTLKQTITVEVREADRAVTLARESINATQKTRVAAEKRLEAEEARFRVGMATVNDVLKYQKDYTDALVSEKRALADYEKAAAALRKATFSFNENF